MIGNAYHYFSRISVGRIQVELRHIRYFLAVVEESHFTRAAERLHVSQPTLSQQIRELEAELGAPLFDRIGKRVRLTAAGEIFREHAQRAAKEIEEARVAISELEGLKRGEIIVGVVQTVNTYLIPGVVARFSAAYPSIRVEVRELASGQIEAGIIAGSLNLGIGFVPPQDEKIEAERLFGEDLVLVVPSGHRLAERKRVRMRELDGEPLVMLSPAYCTRRLVDESLRESGARPRIMVEMNTIDGILATVREGGAATVLPALAAQGTSGVRAVALTEPTPRRAVGLMWLRGGYRHAAAQVFANAVADVTGLRLEREKCETGNPSRFGRQAAGRG